MNDRIRALAHTLWQYHQLSHELSAADAILVLCSHDIAVANAARNCSSKDWRRC